MKSEALEATEAECAEGRTAPRVSLSDIENAILYELYATGAEIGGGFLEGTKHHEPFVEMTAHLTVCLLVLKNGFTIVGKSAPASKDNFDPVLGRKLAYEDAVRQIWPLMGFALRDRLYRGGA